MFYRILGAEESTDTDSATTGRRLIEEGGLLAGSSTLSARESVILKAVGEISDWCLVQ
jgi:hypothetical protein